MQPSSHRVRVLITMPELEGDYDLLRQIAEVSPEVEVEHRICRTSDETAVALRGAEVLYTQAVPSQLDPASRLAWVQLHFSGIDHASWSPIFDESRGIVITNVAGAHAVPIAEYCVFVMGLLLRDFMQLLRDKQTRTWDRLRYPPFELCGRTIGIVGYGHVGGELGRLARACNMRVLALKRHANQRAASGYQWSGVGDPDGNYPDRFFGPGELHELLRESDFVINCLPHTPATKNLFGSAEFSAMKRGAYFVNVGRGETVDYAALVDALRDGRVGGAALDSFATDPHPLAPEDPLWGLDNVFLTPHISGTRYSRQYLVRTNELFCENLRRYLGGEPLINTVARDKGY